jgi:hypothetical protein
MFITGKQEIKACKDKDGNTIKIGDFIEIELKDTQIKKSFK